ARDVERTVLRVEHAMATGVAIDWPERVVANELVLRQPWALLERDDSGALSVRTLLTPRAAAPAQPATEQASGANGDDATAAVPVSVEPTIVYGRGLGSVGCSRR